MKFRYIYPLILFQITIFFVGCSSDQEVVELIGTEVALAMKNTQDANVSQTEAAQNTAAAAAEITKTPTTTPSPTGTATFTPSQSPQPTETDTATPTDVPTETPIGYIPEDAIWFYATSIGTGGNIGCGDTLIKLWTGHVRTGNIVVDLTNALNTVFSVGQYAAGFYNATYPSTLRVKEVSLSENGSATVYFDGSYVPPKDSCDASRYRSQVWGTALQFPEVDRFIPWVGNNLLGDRLAAFSDSGK